MCTLSQLHTQHIDAWCRVNAWQHSLYSRCHTARQQVPQRALVNSSALPAHNFTVTTDLNKDVVMCSTVYRGMFRVSTRVAVDRYPAWQPCTRDALVGVALGAILAVACEIADGARPCECPVRPSCGPFRCPRA